EHHCGLTVQWDQAIPITITTPQYGEGFTMQVQSQGWVMDGGPGGGGTNLINVLPTNRPGNPYANLPGYIEGGFVSYPDSVCKCLAGYQAVFNGASIPYKPTNCNSNWALKCMSEQCVGAIDDMAVPWGRLLGIPEPIGLN